MMKLVSFFTSYFIMMNKNKVRAKYVERVKPFIDNDIIKVFIGQRRVGKSFVLLSIIDLLQAEYGVKKEEIIYINKELVERDHINSYQSLHDEVKDFKYIFIDEIQDIPGREKAIRSLKAEGAKDIYIS